MYQSSYNCAIRGVPDFEVWIGSTIKYKDSFITTCNYREFYESELMELNGKIREVVTGRRDVIKNVYRVCIHNGTPEDIEKAMEGTSRYLEYPSEDEAIQAAKEKIDKAR